MKVFRAVAIVALLAGPAYAQDHVQRYGEPDKDKSFQQMQSDKEADQAYKRSLGNIPDKGPTDPWGNARSAAPRTAAKPAAKTPSKTAKTGSAN
ncbi:MAG: hypothetical protein ACRD9W_21195 [Terriglobia bacterium]